MNTEIKFTDIYGINVNKHVEEKSGLKYLSWSYAWAEIKKLDPKANFIIHENSEGHPFFVSPFGIDVKVSVTFNEITHTMRLPVLDGANKPMKIESYKYSTKNGDKTVQAANSFDINKSIMRCLVKAIALHGLGLYIYNGEDKPEQAPKEEKTVQAKSEAHKANPVKTGELKANPAQVVNAEKTINGISETEHKNIKIRQQNELLKIRQDFEKLGKKVDPVKDLTDDLARNAKAITWWENKLEALIIEKQKEFEATKM